MTARPRLATRAAARALSLGLWRLRLGIGWGDGMELLGFKECTRAPEWAIGPESYPMGQKRTNRTHCSNSCFF